MLGRPEQSLTQSIAQLAEKSPLQLSRAPTEQPGPDTAAEGPISPKSFSFPRLNRAVEKYIFASDRMLYRVSRVSRRGSERLIESRRGSGRSRRGECEECSRGSTKEHACKRNMLSALRLPIFWRRTKESYSL